jgi:hypothetical protein
MKITLQTIGNAELEFDVKDEKEAISRISFWQSLPVFCGICNAQVFFSHRQPQGFDYYGLVCEGTPKHESNFGQFKEGGKLFFKADWHEVQYNSVAAERDAEINRFNDQPPTAPEDERERLLSRISSAEKFIAELGGKVDKVNRSSMSVTQLSAELSDLTDQYNRLKNNR